MREHLLDVVIDVIEEMTDSRELQALQKKGMEKALEMAGVRSSDIQQIVEWVEGFGRGEKVLLQEKPHSGAYFRVFSPAESEHITLEAQDYLLNLLRNQVIGLDLFERILDQIMMLKGRQVDLHHVEWISFMVVMNQAEDQSSIALFEKWMMNAAEGLKTTVH